MTTQLEPQFQLVSTRLLEILRKYVNENLIIRIDKPNQYEFIGPPTTRSRGKEVWFGAVRIGKNYVSYHIMPIYTNPDLLKGISPELKKRMQGKSCFNFTHVDERLFQELAELTERGYECFKKEGFIR
jgi:hypothetical protein